VNGETILDDGGALFPFETMEFEEVPWGVWKGRHPETDAFVGGSISGGQ
jgi:hypothetical protein